MKRLLPLLCCLFLISVCGSGEAAQKTVRLPITIDYPLLRNLLAQNAFPEKDETKTLVNAGNGCTYLKISSPQLSAENETLKIDLKVSARAATSLGDKCFAPLKWQGHLILLQQPSITPDTWQLKFTTIGSRVLDADRQPAQIAGILWNFIEPHITAYLDAIRLNLLPPISDFKNFILPLFPESKQQQTLQMLASMKPQELRVTADALRLTIFTNVAQVYDHSDTGNSTTIDPAERLRLTKTWENWDAFLVYLVTTLSREALTAEEKDILTTVLLDTRYQFVNQLAANTIGEDIVRQQFVKVWAQLAPLFKKHILRDSKSSTALGYLAFVASADALLVFDRLGPTLGVEISTNGLIRLMKMLHASPALLQYRSSINTELQKLFQLEDENDTPVPQNMEHENSSSLLRRIFAPLQPSRAYAAQVPSFKEILQWKVPKSNVQNYITRLEGVLASATGSIISKGQVPPNVQKMYRAAILAMAWQESCFRQFVVKGDRLTYLLSYNGSSVGVMQINERVWRGLYRQDRLRWDINYNAQAGCEIAALYLNKYILNDTGRKNTLDDNTMARTLYAMYNGGPTQYKKFLKRLAADSMYDSDKLFWEKYKWVLADEVDKVSICLTGR
ncbi:MAG: lytic transglycosylase domain-containing protein [Desulfopila sp.]